VLVFMKRTQIQICIPKSTLARHPHYDINQKSETPAYYGTKPRSICITCKYFPGVHWLGRDSNLLIMSLPCAQHNNNHWDLDHNLSSHKILLYRQPRSLYNRWNHWTSRNRLECEPSYVNSLLYLHCNIQFFMIWLTRSYLPHIQQVNSWLAKCKEFKFHSKKYSYPTLIQSLSHSTFPIVSCGGCWQSVSHSLTGERVRWDRFPFSFQQAKPCRRMHNYHMRRVEINYLSTYELIIS